MSQIEKLIEKFIPKGVTIVPLSQICAVKTGEGISKDLISSNPGNYPVINSGREPLGFYSKFNTDNDPIGITSRGAGVGSITWCEGRYFRGNLNYSVTIIDKKRLSVRFLYFWLMANQKKIHALCTFEAIPALNKVNLDTLCVPIPPIEIQNEIVKILDTFSELEAELEAELAAELEARIKQFSYILNRVFDNDAIRLSGAKKLSELGEFDRGSGLQKTDFSEEGTGCIHYGQIYTRFGSYTESVLTYVPHELASKLKKVKQGNLIITTTSENIEDVCKAVVWLGHEEIVIGGHSCVYRHSMDPLFATYLFRSRLFQDQKNSFVQGTKVKDIKPAQVGEILVYVPDLKTQRVIGKQLQEFDKLIVDVAIGLPAEINARKKQYEYYRDKLLTFKELESV